MLLIRYVRLAIDYMFILCFEYHLLNQFAHLLTRFIITLSYNLKDKDGEITEMDVQRYWQKVKKILTNNIPDASGFGLGFMFGLRA